MNYLLLSMSGWAAALTAVGVVWMLGALTLELAGARTREDLSQLVVDAAAGMVLLGTWVSAVVIVGGYLAPYQIGGLMMILVLIAWHKGCVPWIRFSLPEGWASWIVWGLAGATILGLGLLALRDRLWWDGWMMWSQKAQVLLNEGGLPHDFLVGDNGLELTHPDYPLGLSSVVWLAWSMTEVARPVASSVIGWALWVMTALFVGERLREPVGDFVAGLVVLGFSLFWPLLFYAQGGTADILVSLAMVGIVASLYEWLTTSPDEERSALISLAVFLFLATLSKNEGWLVALASTGAGLSLGWSQGRLNKRVLFSFTPLLFPVIWSAFMSSLGVGASFLSRATLLPPEQLLDRALTLWASLRSYTYTAPWSGLMWVIGVGAAGLLASRKRDVLAGLWLVPVGVFVGVVAIYLAIPMDIEWWLSTSQHRVMGQLVPTVLFLSVVSLATSRFQHEPAKG